MLDSMLLVIEQFLIYLPLAAGAYVTIGLLKVPDLALESAFIAGALVGAKVAMIMASGPLGLALTLVASMMSGACVGLVASLINRYGGIAYLLSSIITVGIFHGVLQFIPGAYVSLASDTNLLTIMPLMSKHPEMVALIGISIVVLAFLLIFLRSQLGFCAAFFGKNPNIFSYYGQSAPFIVICTVMISHALVGLSGYLAAQTQGFADIHMAFGKVLFALTALILGKTILRPTRPISYLMPVVGCASYFIMQQLLLNLGFGLTYFTALQAVVILIVLVTQSQDRDSITADHLGV